MIDQIGLWAGFVLTLMVFSCLLGDNFLYRLAIYVFVGLAAGFVTMVTVQSVLIPWINTTIINGNAQNRILGVVPLILGLLLLLKATARFSRIGNLGMAFVVGIGTAIAMVGAISGTLLPLSNATATTVSGDALNGFILVVGVVSTLIYFQYRARRTASGQNRRGLVIRAIGAVGQGFIVVTLGALYGGAILSGLVVFSDRIAFLVQKITGG